MNMVYFNFVGVFIVSEIVLAFIFATISQILYKKMGLDFRSIIKGVIERIFLLVSFYNGYPHALTFFSAIKLATRLTHNEEKETIDKFNDFYLIGNMISVTVSIIYVLILKSLLS